MQQSPSLVFELFEDCGASTVDTKATIKSSTLGLVAQLTTDDNERCDVVNIANR